MALSRDFKDLVKARVKKSPKFRQALLMEAVQEFMNGNVDVGKAVLRDYINATVGFDKLGTLTKRKPESLMRMLSPSGNPTTDNLFGILRHLQKKEGITLEVRAAKHP